MYVVTNKLSSYKDVALFLHHVIYLMICTIKVTDARKHYCSKCCYMSFILEPSYTKVSALLQAQESGTILHQGFSASASPRIQVCVLWVGSGHTTYEAMKPGNEAPLYISHSVAK